MKIFLKNQTEFCSKINQQNSPFAVKYSRNVTTFQVVYRQVVWFQKMPSKKQCIEILDSRVFLFINEFFSRFMS